MLIGPVPVFLREKKIKAAKINFMKKEKPIPVTQIYFFLFNFGLALILYTDT
jgi:hypothetical protein